MNSEEAVFDSGCACRTGQKGYLKGWKLGGLSQQTLAMSATLARTRGGSIHPPEGFAINIDNLL